MASIQAAATMKPQTFDIRVALVGHVSVGKSTLLNALLGDKFSQVALKRTTECVNSFRITQPGQDCSWNNGNRKPEDILQEISKDNETMRAYDVEEKEFEVTIGHEICQMRKDTQLVLIDIPGINGAFSGMKYKKYVISKWDTFDCVVVVMDALQGVNTEEQDDLLLFLYSKLRRKRIPIIVVGNKVDDPHDDDTIQVVEEIRLKLIDLFESVDFKPMRCDGGNEEQAKPRSEEPMLGGGDTSEDDESSCEHTGIAMRCDGDNAEQAKPRSIEHTGIAFVPMSAKHAFTYMKAGCMDLERLDDPNNPDIINMIGYTYCGSRWSMLKGKDKIDAVSKIIPKDALMKAAGMDLDKLDKIGYSKYGLRWSMLNGKDKLDAVSKILRDLPGLDERLASTNFTSLLSTLSDYVGGNERQQVILTDQVEIELKKMKTHYNSGEAPNMKPISESILELFEKRKSIGRIDSLFQKAFWEVYEMCFKDIRENPNADFGPTALNPLNRPFMELEKYREVSLMLEWDEQATKAVVEMERLIRIQLEHLMQEIKTWSLRSYCESMGHIPTRSESAFGLTYRLKNCNIDRKNGENSTKEFNWKSMSPKDWICLLESLSLVWNHDRFIENFGREKIELEKALMTFKATFESFCGISLDACTTSGPYDRLLLYAYKDQQKMDESEFETKIHVPSSLDDPLHWGFLAWKYINICAGKGRGEKRKASSLSD